MTLHNGQNETSANQQEAPRRVNMRLLTLLEKAQYSVALYDRNRQIFYISPAFEGMLGYSPDEYMRSKKAFEAVHPDDRLFVFEAFSKVFASPDESRVIVCRVQHKDGAYRWLEITYTNLLEEDDICAIVANFRDISNRKQLEATQQELFVREQKALAEVEVQQKRFSSAVMNAPALIIVLKGPSHVIDFVNMEFVRIFGKRQDFGKTIREAYPELEALGLSGRLDSIYQTGKPYTRYEIAVPILTTNGLSQWYFNLVLQPTRDAEEEIDGIIGFAFDVTQQIMARQVVEEREEQYRFLANAMPQQVWTALPDGRLNYVSQQVSDYFSQSTDDIIGQGWQNFLHPDDLLSCLETWQHSLQTGEPYQIEFRLRASDGTYKWHLGRALPLINNGQVVRWFGTNTDIHEFKKLQAQKDEFISMASHELRTPMTTIKAWTQIQKRQFEKIGHKDAVLSLTKMETQINRVNRLISDLLDISKIELGNLVYTQENVSLDTIIRESVDMVQQISITHTISVDGHIHQDILGDKDRLEQVFTNLLNNAIKYSPNANEVSVSIGTQAHQAFVRIHDHGIGIPIEHQSRIFDRFYRVSDGEGALFSGLGMGLYIAFAIVARHNGKIVVESEEGKGSTFTVYFPLHDDFTDELL